MIAYKVVGVKKDGTYWSVFPLGTRVQYTLMMPTRRPKGGGPLTAFGSLRTARIFLENNRHVCAPEDTGMVSTRILKVRANRSKATRVWATVEGKEVRELFGTHNAIVRHLYKGGKLDSVFLTHLPLGTVLCDTITPLSVVTKVQI
jgi:hypothetical protein